jgi:hypothetical protein
MEKNMKKIVISALLLVISSISFAHDQDGDKGEHKKRFQPTPEMKAAFESCRSSVTQDANGRPDREAFKKCMEDKGFKRPEHEHPKHDKEGN